MARMEAIFVFWRLRRLIEDEQTNCSNAKQIFNQANQILQIEGRVTRGGGTLEVWSRLEEVD
jgi:hypothetical protein